MKKHIIVVGAVAGGATSASQIRRLDKDSRITVYEKDSFMSFANCGLPYYLGNVIEERDDILSTNPEKFKAYKDIDVKVKHEVLKIDDKKQTVTVKNHFTGETFEDAYDALVLSPGARASQLNFDVPHLFTLRNMDDTDQIDTYIRQYNVKTVLIVGAGYVSLEMVENMHHRGLHPTLIHRSEAVNKLMDQDMNSVIFDALNQYNIPYRLNEEIKSIDGHTVTFTSGAVEDYDLIIAGVGVRPNSEFIQNSGIQLDAKGYIPVNDKFETNIPNIYAVGDIVTSFYRHIDLPAHVPLAWGAHRGASIIAEQIAGHPEVTFKGYVGANIVKFFDYTLASTGISPQELKNFDYQMVEVNLYTHAGYYPGNSKVHLRAYFDKETRRILRAAAVGQKDVDKRIDVLTMALMHQATIDELTEFEVAYAPPFAHPKDLINMLGYKARNL
ncbi:CoA-disulfide reductase [Staphylococcus pseudintermedius]|nr:CoA-disulfide reductase [Staphylococcus pseudintermedius]EGQ4358084.1 CoA-disulfide reductase [Staphylococcus pseudintermedius]EHT3180206.1 CoA-disulfide reductase [Staphylococcus pseudintermedius]EIT1258407.1 CoA-disulfide reductase [Staphylococcus pseudintermedius]EKH7772223.1 CoA-disulfide reductase [Staphylococcus pseudintermedius]